MLYVRSVENSKDWDEYAEARGEVSVPSNTDVRLCVSHEALSDLSPLSALNEDDLQVLAITCTRKFEGDQLKNIGGLRGLLGLALWETEIGDKDFSHLSRLSNLRWLDIGDTQITDEGLSFIRQMMNLEELSLLNTKIGNAGLSHLVGLNKLKRLDLMGTKVDDSGFEMLRQLTNLDYLRIMDTGISYHVYAKLKRALPNCRITYHEFA